MANPSYPPPADTPMTPPPMAPEPAAAPASNRGWMAITSLVLGIINLCAMLVPYFCGVLLPVVGLILGILGLNSNRRGMAIVGIVLAVITLCIAIIWTISFRPILRQIGYPGF